MTRYLAAGLFTVGVVLLLCPDSDAGWRRRHEPPCYCVPAQCGPYATPAGQSWHRPILRTTDKRLQTIKAATPDVLDEPSAAPSFRESDDDTFTVRRHDRGRAKTTFSAAPVETFTDLGTLILTLPLDEDMIPITEKAWDFDRVEAEQRNVRVIAYVFAITKESDNDFHVIIDDDGLIEDGAKFNVEVTGIPTEGPDVEALSQVRAAFKARFGGNPPTQYKPFFDPPLRVMIEGSLFFDRDHKAGAVGPTGFRPASAWEIHPVRSIQFLGN